MRGGPPRPPSPERVGRRPLAQGRSRKRPEEGRCSTPALTRPSQDGTAADRSRGQHHAGDGWPARAGIQVGSASSTSPGTPDATTLPITNVE